VGPEGKLVVSGEGFQRTQVLRGIYTGPEPSQSIPSEIRVVTDYSRGGGLHSAEMLNVLRTFKKQASNRKRGWACPDSDFMNTILIILEWFAGDGGTGSDLTNNIGFTWIVSEVKTSDALNIVTYLDSSDMLVEVNQTESVMHSTGGDYS